MGLRDLLRTVFGWLAPKTNQRQGSNRRPRTGITDPETLRPQGAPVSLGPKATMVEASSQGHTYMLKKWSDLPVTGRRELVRLVERRRELTGPGFVEIAAVGERAQERQAGYVFCIQEHHPRTLKTFLQQMHEPVPLETAATIVRQVASALQQAHEKTLVHGSLSPEAIYLSTHSGPEPGTAAVDFVRFTAMDLAQNPSFTIAQVFPTGRTYLAPEVLLANPPDEQSDLYVLGIVAYEIFTRKLPFGDDGASTTMKVRGILNAQAQPMSRHRPEVPQRWESAVMKLLAKDRKLRYRTAEEFLRDVEKEL